MIFATVGTLHYPFTRLMEALELVQGELVVQHGPAEPPRNAALAVPFMEFPEVIEHVDAAAVVITHAGCGTISHAIQAGHTPIVVPRLRRYGEHVDDHQLELAGAVAAERRATLVLDLADLPQAIAATPPRRTIEQMVPGPLHTAVRGFLIEAGARQHR